MKYVIRRSIFDSNSSTAHSCVIMTQDLYDKWKDSGLYYCDKVSWAFDGLPEDKRPKVGALYTQDEVINFYSLTKYGYDGSYDEEFDTPEEAKDAYIRETDDFINYESFFNDEYLESDTTYYTTPGGEKIVVSCKYGDNY